MNYDLIDNIEVDGIDTKELSRLWRRYTRAYSVSTRTSQRSDRLTEVVRQRQELIRGKCKAKARDKKPKRKQAKTREITRRHTRGENSIFY